MTKQKLFTIISNVLLYSSTLLLIISFFMRDSDFYQLINSIWGIVFTLYWVFETWALRAIVENLEDELNDKELDVEEPNADLGIKNAIEMINETIHALPNRIAPAAFLNHTTVAMDRAKDFYNDLLLRQNHQIGSLQNELIDCQVNLKKDIDESLNSTYKIYLSDRISLIEKYIKEIETMENHKALSSVLSRK